MVIFKKRFAFFGWALIALLAPASVWAEIPTGLVERLTVRERVTAEGVIEAVLEAKVAAEVPGRVVEVRVDAGERVRAGQVLFVLDDASIRQEVAAARARLAQAEANLTNARAEWERTKNLFAQKFISESRLDSARTALNAAEAERNAAAAQVARAEAGLAYTQVKAPFDAVVAERLANKGDMAQPGQPLAVLFQPGAMRAVAQVPEERVKRLGQPLTATVEVPAVNRTWVATVVTVLPSVDPRTQTRSVRADLPADAGQVLVPGSFARVELSAAGGERLVVPQQAVIRRGELTAVYVATERGWRLRQVRLGETVAENRVQVLAGLAEGDRVALDPVKAGLAVAKGEQ
ncbi:MAG: efflux RND transporter periplasmic adaptor subunit [Hydrogenophilus sp.]|nr:efflux RND transporter periplasmic adaptor subunit [Hydrogenophilus sp.]